MSGYQISDCIDFRHFGSLSAFVDYADGITAEDRKRLAQTSIASEKRGKDRREFTGTYSYKEASELVRSGWPEGVRDLQKAIDVIEQGKGISPTRGAEMDIMGPIPITGAWCAGDPECMLNPAEIIERPVVNIIVDGCVSCRIERHQIINRGAAILALVDQLEATGVRCQIYMTIGSGRITAYLDPENRPDVKNPHILTVIKLKDAQDDWNLHSMSYAMVHPSMLRRHWFRVFERCPYIVRTGGYGKPTKIVDIEGASEAIGDIDLYFSGIDVDNEHHFNDPVKAAEHTLQVAKDAGVIG